MLSLQAKIRDITGRKTKNLLERGQLPAIVYGPKIENKSLALNYKEFEKIYKEAGEASLLKLKIKDQKSKTEEKELQVLIHSIQKHPVTEKFLHVDFYQPKLEEKVTVTVPLVFESEAPGVKDLGGVLVKNISQLEIKALPQDLSKEIKVDVSGLKTFDDMVQIKDLIVPSGVEILKELEEVVVLLARPKEEIAEERPVEKEMPTEEAPVGEEKSSEEKAKKEEKK